MLVSPSNRSTMVATSNTPVAILDIDSESSVGKARSYLECLDVSKVRWIKFNELFTELLQVVERKMDRWPFPNHSIDIEKRSSLPVRLRSTRSRQTTRRLSVSMVVFRTSLNARRTQNKRCALYLTCSSYGISPTPRCPREQWWESAHHCHTHVHRIINQP